MAAEEDVRTALIVLEAQLQTRRRMPHYDRISLGFLLLVVVFTGLALFDPMGSGSAWMLVGGATVGLLWSLATDVRRYAQGRGLDAVGNAALLSGASAVAVAAAFDAVDPSALVHQHLDPARVVDRIEGLGRR